MIFTFCLLLLLTLLRSQSYATAAPSSSNAVFERMNQQQLIVLYANDAFLNENKRGEMGGEISEAFVDSRKPRFELNLSRCCNKNSSYGNTNLY